MPLMKSPPKLGQKRVGSKLKSLLFAFSSDFQDRGHGGVQTWQKISTQSSAYQQRLVCVMWSYEESTAPSVPKRLASMTRVKPRR